MKKIKAIKLGLILLIGASMALLLHCNALATANKNELSKTEWEKLTKDLHYNDDVKKANESALQQKTPHSKSFSMPTFNLSRTAQIVLILLVAIFIFIMASGKRLMGSIQTRIETFYCRAEPSDRRGHRKTN